MAKNDPKKSSKPATSSAGSASAPAQQGVLWLDAPQEHDYPAAAAYLSLTVNHDSVKRTVDAMRTAPTTHYKAKDLLRASRLPLLEVTNVHVASDLAKLRQGERLSPILLVRGHLAADVPLVIADGYHRVCASYHTDENTDVPVRIVDLH